MKKILYSFVCLATIIASACSDDDTAAPQPTLQLASTAAGVTVNEDGTQLSAALTAEEAAIDITVASNWNWTVETASGNWCAAEVTQTGLRLVVPANTLTQPRTAALSVVSTNETGEVRAKISVEQAAAIAGESSLSVTLNDADTEVLLPDAGGSYRVGVTAGGGWQAVGDSNWFSIEQDADGFTVSAPENTTLGMLSGTIRVTTGKSGADETVTLPVSQFSSAPAMVIELTVGEPTANMGALPFENIGVINCLVDWGDGSLSRIISSWPQHQYEAAGVYEVKIIGKVSSFRANQLPQFSDELKNCVTAIKDWGDIGLESLKRGFYKCQNLREIAAPDADSFSQLTTVYECFYSNIALESLPDGMFATAPELESAYGTFQGCENLKAAPARMFAGCSKCTDFFRLFWKCTSMIVIPADLFEGCTAAAKFGQAFYNLPITSIPENLFAPCVAATDFSYAFNGSAELTAIPAGLFAKNIAATSFLGVFADCTKLTAIPVGIFANAPGVTNLSGAFNGCAELTEIPADLFAMNPAVTNFGNVFADCTKLTAIPVGIFANAPGVTSFSGAFNGCTELTAIPVALFAANTSVTNMGSVFANCTKLTAIPADIFAGLTKITSFNSAFMGCTALTAVPASIFDDAKAVTNFGKTFSGCTALGGESPCTTIDGVKYHLYERADNAAFAVVKTPGACFAGCDGLSDYPTISTAYPKWL